MTEKKWTCSWIRFIFLFTFTLMIDNMVMKLMKFLKKVHFAFLITFTFTLIIVNIVMKSIYLHLSQYLLTSYWIIYICCHWYQHHEFFGTFSFQLVKCDTRMIWIFDKYILQSTVKVFFQSSLLIIKSIHCILTFNVFLLKKNTKNGAKILFISSIIHTQFMSIWYFFGVKLL